MTAQHAPGPWYVFEGYDEKHRDYTVESSVTIAWIRESTFNPNPKATAQLMAAAPDLLEALKDALCALECCGKDFPAATKARAAIAKATTE